MKYSIYNKTTGQIIKNVLCQEGDLSLQFNNSTEDYLPGYIDDSRYYIANDEVIAMPDKPSSFHIFNWDSKQWADPRTVETEWLEVKAKRGSLLESSDWTQMPDVILSNKEAWATYRQQLRDVTTQSDPYNIVWPTPPGG